MARLSDVDKFRGSGSGPHPDGHVAARTKWEVGDDSQER